MTNSSGPEFAPTFFQVMRVDLGLWERIMGERVGIGNAARARLALGLSALRRIGAEAPDLSSGPDEIPGIGHNGGPPLDEQSTHGWRAHCWRRAHAKAWKTPPREIALRRLRRAEELGMTYREYTAIVLDRGIFL